MLRIHQLFFFNTFVLFAGTLVIASVISYFTLKEILIQNHVEDLKKIVELVTVQSYSFHNVDSYVNAIHNQTDYRATVFDLNGTVLAESNLDKRSLENQNNRIEVMHAMTEPYGITTRYSQTMHEDYIFIAKQIVYEGEIVVLRLGIGLQDVMHNFYTLLVTLASVFALFLFIALGVSYRISTKVREDVLKITNYLDEISNKNYKAILKPEYIQEFLYIALLLKNLVKKISNRDKQKRKYTAKLRLINKQQNDILSAISHEFKNPIAAIAGYAETLRDDMHLNVAIREKFLGKIHSNAMKISHMLDRLALSVKLENNDLSIKPTTFDLDILCRDATSSLQGKYPNRRIVYEGKSRVVYADKTMIDLVITNLIDNAIKYSEESVVLRLNEHSVDVIDQGIGIPPNELENITNKFYRVQKNRWDNSMGLGLAIVSYILNLHQSALKIHSVQDIGSTFSFSIDSFKAAPAARKK
ncbi:MAG: sensor histidine kinase [Sulfuricurvum sp.]